MTSSALSQSASSQSRIFPSMTIVDRPGRMATTLSKNSWSNIARRISERPLDEIILLIGCTRCPMYAFNEIYLNLDSVSVGAYAASGVALSLR
jgi:hypothetical protein